MTEKKTVGRRRVITGLAWAVPVAAVGTFAAVKLTECDAAEAWERWLAGNPIPGATLEHDAEARRWTLRTRCDGSDGTPQTIRYRIVTSYGSSVGGKDSVGDLTIGTPDRCEGAQSWSAASLDELAKVALTVTRTNTQTEEEEFSTELWRLDTDTCEVTQAPPVEDPCSAAADAWTAFLGDRAAQAAPGAADDGVHWSLDPATGAITASVEKRDPASVAGPLRLSTTINYADGSSHASSIVVPEDGRPVSHTVRAPNLPGGAPRIRSIITALEGTAPAFAMLSKQAEMKQDCRIEVEVSTAGS